MNAQLIQDVSLASKHFKLLLKRALHFFYQEIYVKNCIPVLFYVTSTRNLYINDKYLKTWASGPDQKGMESSMEWIQKWLDDRRVAALKKRVERMRLEAEEAELEPLMPAMETISRRIRRERLVILERAMQDIERRQAASAENVQLNQENSAVSQV